MAVSYKESIKGMLLVCLIMLTGWFIITYFNLVDTFFIPSPSRVFRAAHFFLKKNILQHHMLITLQRFFLGFFIGGSIGFIFGMICGISKRASIFLQPVVYLFVPIPRFALLPLIILLFGIGFGSKVCFIAIGAFFPVAINTIAGIREIKTEYMDIAKHYGAKGWALFKLVIMPACLPSLLSGIRIAVTVTLTSVTVVEFLTASDGIGAMMWLSLQTLQTERLFVYIGLIAILNLSMQLLINLIRYLCMPWHRCDVI